MLPANHEILCVAAAKTLDAIEIYREGLEAWALVERGRWLRVTLGSLKTVVAEAERGDAR